MLALQGTSLPHTVQPSTVSRANISNRLAAGNHRSINPRTCDGFALCLPRRTLREKSVRRHPRHPQRLARTRNLHARTSRRDFSRRRKKLFTRDSIPCPFIFFRHPLQRHRRYSPSPFPPRFHFGVIRQRESSQTIHHKNHPNSPAMAKKISAPGNRPNSMQHLPLHPPYHRQNPRSRRHPAHPQRRATLLRKLSARHRKKCSSRGPATRTLRGDKNSFRPLPANSHPRRRTQILRYLPRISPPLFSLHIAADHFRFAKSAILRRIAQNLCGIRAQAHALSWPLAPFFSRDF